MELPRVHGARCAAPLPPALAMTRSPGLRAAHAQAYVLTTRALGDALSESMAGDMSIVAIGILAMFAFTYSVLTRRLDVVRSRLALTAVGALAVLLGAAGALGLVSAFGVPVTDLNQVLLYVTLGIGVDGACAVPAATPMVASAHPHRALGPAQMRSSSRAASIRLCTRRVRMHSGASCQL